MKALRLTSEDIDTLPAAYHRYAGLGPYLLPGFGRVYWKRLDYCLELLERHLPKNERPRFCDIGSGLGVFLRSVQRNFPHANVLGLDAYPTRVLRAAQQAWFQRRAIHFVQGDLHQLPFRNQSIDALSALDVLEHVQDPPSAIEEAKRVLNPNGVFLISVPTEGAVLRAVRWAYFIGRHEEEGANPHWNGTIPDYRSFYKEVEKRFSLVEGAYIPFGVGGPHLNYDYIAVARPRR